MKPARGLRALIAWIALVGVLFSQLAVAAYACPGKPVMAQAALAAAMEEMPDCHQAPGSAAIDALCQAHCQQGDQSVERVAVPPPAPAVPSDFRPARLVPIANLAGPPSAQLSLLERPTEPPAAVRHCRLLI